MASPSRHHQEYPSAAVAEFELIVSVLPEQLAQAAEMESAASTSEERREALIFRAKVVHLQARLGDLAIRIRADRLRYGPQ